MAAPMAAMKAVRLVAQMVAYLVDKSAEKMVGPKVAQ